MTASASWLKQLVDLGTRDVGRAVTGVGLDVDDVLAEDAASGVDVLDGQVDARELRRAEEGEVTGLREQRAEGERAVTLGGRRFALLAGVGVTGAVVVSAATARGEDERGRGEGRAKAACTGRADHGASGLTRSVSGLSPSGTSARNYPSGARIGTSSGQPAVSCPICDQIVGHPWPWAQFLQEPCSVSSGARQARPVRDDALGDLAHREPQVHRGLLDPAERLGLAEPQLAPAARALARSTALRVSSRSVRSATSRSSASSSANRLTAISIAGHQVALA